VPGTQQKLTGWTNNALVTGLIIGLVTVVLSGVLSYVVAQRTTNEQDQAAARQAMSGQQVSAVVQLETASNTYYQTVYALWSGCEEHTLDGCTSETGSGTAFGTAQAVFNADRLNISDPRASALAAQLANVSDNALQMVGPGMGQGSYIAPVVTTYQDLITRCGQLIQGQ
jgi:hypothetical protein